MTSLRFPRASVLALVLVLCLAGGAATALADGGGGQPPTGPSSARPAPIVYRPPGLSMSAKVPLVVAFYGATGCPQCMEGLTHFEALARRYGFVVAYPGSGLTNSNVWSSPSDIPYVRSLISQIESSQNIDRSRVYAVGFSAGGRFTYQVGCALSRQITAIAVVSSLQRPYKCSLTHPVAELTIDGTTEPFYAGMAARGIPSAATIAQWWRQRDGCGGTTRTTSSGPVTMRTTGPCVDGSSVALYTIQGGHHTWPGCCSRGRGDPDAQWNATAGVWSFLSSQRTGSLTTPGARVTATHFTGAGHARSVRSRLRLGESVTVTETLLANGRKVVSGKSRLSAGNRTAQLKLPAGIQRGFYTLKLVIVDAYGRTMAVSRRIHVP